jgi:hypothetical protein
VFSSIALPPALSRQDPGHQLRGSPDPVNPDRDVQHLPNLAAGDLGPSERGDGLGAPLA